MFLKKSTRKKTGRTQLSIVHNYWDSIRKKTRTRTIKSLGYLDELQKEYNDPLAHFEAVAAQMNEEHKNNNSVEMIKFDFNEKIIKDNTNRKNFVMRLSVKYIMNLKLINFLLTAKRV